jgi:hypothetical protein
MEQLQPELDDTTCTYTRTVDLEAGCVLTSFNGRFLEFPDPARENQLFVSAGLMPVDETGKVLAEGTTLTDVREWNLEREVPAYETDDSRWGTEQVEGFPVSVDLDNIGIISDCLVGRAS